MLDTITRSPSRLEFGLIAEKTIRVRLFKDIMSHGAFLRSGTLVVRVCVSLSSPCCFQPELGIPIAASRWNMPTTCQSTPLPPLFLHATFSTSHASSMPTSTEIGKLLPTTSLQLSAIDRLIIGVTVVGGGIGVVMRGKAQADKVWYSSFHQGIKIGAETVDCRTRWPH